MSDIAANHRVLLLLRNLLIFLLLFCIGLQFLIEASAVNLGCSFLAGLAGAVLLKWHFEPAKLMAHPISGLMVAMPICTSVAFPLIFTTAEWKPIVFNLSEPVTTFGVAVVVCVVLVIAHRVYRSLDFFAAAQEGIQTRVFKPLKSLNAPSPLQLWLISGIGFLALFYVFVYLGASSIERRTGGVVLKLVEGLMPFAYSAFIIILPGLYSVRRKSSAVHYVLLLAYFLVLLAFAVASNYRGAFALAMMMPVLCYVLGMMTGSVRSPRYSTTVLICGVILAVVVFWAFSNLAIAMQMARVNRGHASGLDMVRSTISSLGDKAARQDFERNLYDVDISEFGYSEYYIGNPVISRFLMTKFHDNGHFYATFLSPVEKENFRDFMRQRFWSQLPGPLLSIAGISVDKAGVSSISYGDWFVLTVTKIDYGAFRVGSYQAGALVAFGIYFPLVIFGASFVGFFIGDCFVKRSRIMTNGRLNMVATGFVPVGLIFVYSLIFYTERESIVDWFGFAMRYFPQIVLIYTLFYWATEFFSPNKDN